MNRSLTRLLYWGPRGLTILFILFLALFALDVFGEGYTFSETVVALFMHLIPNMILAIILIVAWKREWIGAVLFGGMGAFYLFWAWGKFHISAYFLISGPLFLVALLFLTGWVYRAEIRG
jgi:hypothetical protein